MTAQTSHLYGFTKVIKFIAYTKKNLQKPMGPKTIIAMGA